MEQITCTWWKWTENLNRSNSSYKLKCTWKQCCTNLKYKNVVAQGWYSVKILKTISYKRGWVSHHTAFCNNLYFNSFFCSTWNWDPPSFNATNKCHFTWQRKSKNWNNTNKISNCFSSFLIVLYSTMNYQHLYSHNNNIITKIH